jgi:hypothetical protein
MRAVVLLLLASSFALVRAEPPPWIDLVGDKAGAVWKNDKGWLHASEVGVDETNARRLTSKDGKGILVNGKTGRLQDLITKEAFGDLELEMEFFIPKGSNSGVKFHSLYEIQICDSHGKKADTGDSCGGIYPRAELRPKYTYLDKGIAPKVNAAKPAGEWQTLHAIFLAPRFDAEGKKVKNARIVKATLNGQAIHEEVELKTPTGHNWVRKEVAKGSLMLQGDHGPVAFRKVRVRAVKE